MRLINRCPHSQKSGIYGDEINHSAGYRLRCDDCGLLLDGPVSLAQDLPQIIRKLSELEALDPDAVLVHGQGLVGSSTGIIHMIKFPTFERPSILPAVVVATGSQVRAARQVLEQEHGR